MCFSGVTIEPNETDLNEEFQKAAEYVAQYLMPNPGAIPSVPGIDIYGITLPLNGLAGGDLVTYVNFQECFDLDARIRRALAWEQSSMAQALKKLKHKGGILVADVAGHAFADAARALMLHQTFHTAACYEMDLNGKITLRLFEQINSRFLKSSKSSEVEGEQEGTSFITLIYGEISHTGRFRFVNAGHPSPLVFSREYDRFGEIDPERLVSYPPVGLQPSEGHADAERYQRALGYKKRYTANYLNLMGHGDVLLLYSDGLLDPLSPFSQEQLERAVSHSKDGSAKDICETIIGERKAAADLTDDLSLVVIKYR